MADIEYIRRSEIYARLTAIVEVRFFEIICEAAALREAPHDVMTRCHQHAYDRALSIGSSIAFLAPDVIFSDGSLAAIEARGLEGYGILLSTGLLVAEERGRPWIEQHCTKPDGSLCLSGSQAVRLVCLYPQESFVFNRINRPPIDNASPGGIWASVDEHGMIRRDWRQHPALIKPARSIELFDPVDSGALFEMIRDGGQSHYLFDNTDELCMVELSPFRRRPDHKHEFGDFSVDQFADWVALNTSPSSRQLARRNGLCLVDGSAVPSAISVSRLLDDCVESVLDRVADLYGGISFVNSIDEIDRTAPTYFFGCGMMGKSLFHDMSLTGPWGFVGFIDSYATGEYMGYPIHPPQWLRDVSGPHTQIVVTSESLPQIARVLRAVGVSKAKWAGVWYRRRQHNARVDGVRIQNDSRSNAAGASTVDRMGRQGERW